MLIVEDGGLDDQGEPENLAACVDVLNKHLKPDKEITAGLIARLQREGYLRDIEVMGEVAVRDAAKYVRQIRRDMAEEETSPRRRGVIGPNPSTGPRTLIATLQARSAAFQMALTAWVADDAEADSDVAAFRQKHLPDGLPLLPGQIQNWVTQQAAQQSKNVKLAVVPVPLDWERSHAIPPISDDIAVSTRVTMFNFLVPPKKFNDITESEGKESGQGIADEIVPWELNRAVAAPGGVLFKLNGLAERLARVHGWEKSQAATWVLTGWSPLIGLIRVTEQSPPVINNEWRAWGQRIKLVVHPAATAQEVANAYVSARKELELPETYGKIRVRGLSISHLRLTAFVAGRTGTWKQKMDSWHEEYSHIKHYSQLTNFIRDALDARMRVLNLAYSPQKGETSGTAIQFDMLGRNLENT
ncbi:hypothetical protein [Umezawaea sp. NPDC059074]|uniref:hypothetical protein n=1 Tax=Umezawaea sp. NPDC059074 TaxID=3346716 RepID=UPI0036B4D953